MSIDEVAGEVARFPAGHVVVTGGEPMISPEIVGLTGKLRDAGLHITVETAGTCFVPVACDLMSISPKLANSTPHEREGGRWAAQHERLRYQSDVLKRLMAEYDYQLKFVVSSEADLAEIDTMQAQLNAPREKVLLMPEGVRSDVLRERGLWLAEVCKTHGYRYSPRLHVDLWGDKRGV